MFEIGSSLRDARLRQGLEFTQLEIDTKIRAKYLRALEEEDFSLLPGEAYVKGFLRIYADRLGLEGQLYVDEYNSRFSLTEEPVFSARPRRTTRRSRLESHAVLIALAGIVAVTVLVIAAWQLGGSGAGTPGDTGAVETGEPAEDPLAPTTEPPAATTPEVPPAAEPGASPAGVVLTVTATRGSSAAEVRRGSARGELLWEGTIEAGASQTFGVDKRLWLRLDRPRNLELELNGERVEGAAGAGPSIIRVTADGVRLLDPS